MHENGDVINFIGIKS